MGRAILGVLAGLVAMFLVIMGIEYVGHMVYPPPPGLNPMVTEEGVRCYAGIPLVTSRGHTLGTLCVIGTEARTFPEDEMEALRALARRAVERIEERRALPGMPGG